MFEFSVLSTGLWYLENAHDEIPYHLIKINDVN